MKKIIQIRGANATGKTTAVRQFIEKHNLKLTFVSVKGKETPFYVSEDRNIVVLGRYDKTTGGCDLFSGKSQVIAAIMYAVKTYGAETIVFEGFIYGKSFAFGHGLNGLSKILGYEYVGVVLSRDFNHTVELLTARNGGSYFSIENLRRTCTDVEKSYRKLKAAGVKMKNVNADSLPLEKMYTVLEEEL